MRPSLLIITNQPLPGCAGQVNGFEILVQTGELDFVQTISFRGVGPQSRTFYFSDVLRAIADSTASHVMIWSPGNFPEKASEFEQLLEVLGTRHLIVWEGDAWGRGKPIRECMRLWLKRADTIFTVAGDPQTTLLRQAGAKNIYRTYHTYCHVTFSKYEHHIATHTNSLVTLIGANCMRVPFPYFTGMPGSWQRRRLALSLKRTLGEGFHVYGKGWSKSIADGPLDFALQIDAINDSRLSVNWDHFATYYDYFSDRLPISMLAGRPHVTSAHPGMEWAPDGTNGLYQEATVSGVIERTLSLLDENPEALMNRGVQLHSWVNNRLSHRQAARHMMSIVSDKVRPVGMDPWSLLI